MLQRDCRRHANYAALSMCPPSPPVWTWQAFVFIDVNCIMLNVLLFISQGVRRFGECIFFPQLHLVTMIAMKCRRTLTALCQQWNPPVNSARSGGTHLCHTMISDLGLERSIWTSSISSWKRGEKIEVVFANESGTLVQKPGFSRCVCVPVHVHVHVRVCMCVCVCM